MNNILRVIRENKLTITIIIGGIIFVLGIIQMLDYLIRTKKVETPTYNDKKSSSYSDSTLQSAISKNSKIDENAVNYKKTIEKFIKLCNEGKTQEAYSMVSKECQEVFYQDYEKFYNDYYKNNFKSAKTYTIQNWINNIFKVDLKDDILITGGNTSSSIQDFITVISINNEYKLNINGYIGRKNINKKTEKDNIVFKVLKKDTSMEYEKYYLEITNNSNQDILLDDLKSANTIYLIDSKGIKYPATNEGLTKELLYVRKQNTIKINIKFTNSYVADRELNYMVFSSVSNDGSVSKSEYKIDL